MIEGDEDGVWTEKVLGKWAQRANVDARLQAERIAGMTRKQRQARKPPKQQINFRASAETKAAIDELVAKLDLTMTDLIELAIHRLHDAEIRGANK
jgi:Ribbon-helix-helix protein, copG family